MNEQTTMWERERYTHYIYLCLLKERVYKTKIKGKMKSTIIIVLTLTICALSSTVHASNLRRATTNMGKMDQFMALYGDEILDSICKLLETEGGSL